MITDDTALANMPTAPQHITVRRRRTGKRLHHFMFYFGNDNTSNATLRGLSPTQVKTTHGNPSPLAWMNELRLVMLRDIPNLAIDGVTIHANDGAVTFANHVLLEERLGRLSWQVQPWLDACMTMNDNDGSEQEQPQSTLPTTTSIAGLLNEISSDGEDINHTATIRPPPAHLDLDLLPVLDAPDDKALDDVITTYNKAPLTLPPSYLAKLASKGQATNRTWRELIQHPPKLTLEVNCGSSEYDITPLAPSAEQSGRRVSDDATQVKLVRAHHLRLVNGEDTFNAHLEQKCGPLKPAEPKTLLATVVDRQRLRVEANLVIGYGWQHAKWGHCANIGFSPVYQVRVNHTALTRHMETQLLNTVPVSAIVNTCKYGVFAKGRAAADDAAGSLSPSLAPIGDMEDIFHVKNEQECIGCYDCLDLLKVPRQPTANVKNVRSASSSSSSPPPLTVQASDEQFRMFVHLNGSVSIHWLIRIAMHTMKRRHPNMPLPLYHYE